MKYRFLLFLVAARLAFVDCLYAQVVEDKIFTSAQMHFLQEDFDFQCPGDSFLTGIRSSFDKNMGTNSINDGNSGDRVFRFVCKTFKDGQNPLYKSDCSDTADEKMTVIEKGVSDYNTKRFENIKRKRSDVAFGSDKDYLPRNMHKDQGISIEKEYFAHQISSLFYCMFIGTTKNQPGNIPPCGPYINRARERLFGMTGCKIKDESGAEYTHDSSSDPVSSTVVNQDSEAFGGGSIQSCTPGEGASDHSCNLIQCPKDQIITKLQVQHCPEDVDEEEKPHCAGGDLDSFSDFVYTITCHSLKQSEK